MMSKTNLDLAVWSWYFNKTKIRSTRPRPKRDQYFHKKNLFSVDYNEKKYFPRENFSRLNNHDV